HPADVVVVGVLEAPDEAAALVGVAGNRLEGDRKDHILVVGVLGYTDVEDPAGTLGELGQSDPTFRRGCVILDHSPVAAFALAGLLDFPASRDLADIVLAEWEGAHLAFVGPRGCTRAGEYCQHCCPSHCSVSWNRGNGTHCMPD